MKNLIKRLSSVVLIASLVGVPAFAFAERGRGSEGDGSRGRSGSSGQAMQAVMIPFSSSGPGNGRDVDRRDVDFRLDLRRDIRDVERRDVDLRIDLRRDIRNVDRQDVDLRIRRDVDLRDIDRRIERRIEFVRDVDRDVRVVLARPADEPRIRVSDDGRVNIRGAMITSIASSNQTFQMAVLGRSFTVNAAGAQLRDRDGTLIAFSALAVGHEVRVRGVFSPATSTSVVAATRVVDRSLECFIDDDEEFLNVNENVCAIVVQPVPEDVRAPALRGIVALPATTTAVIQWRTNEPATSKVFFGTTTPLDINAVTTRSVTQTALVRNHSILLSGLAPNTMFNFIVRSADAAGNIATSGQFSFTTLMLP